MPPIHSLTPSWPTHRSLGLRDFAFRNIVIPIARFTGLPPTKTRYNYPCVNPMALMAQIYGPTLLSFEPSNASAVTPLLLCEIQRLTGPCRFSTKNSDHPSLPLRACPPVVRHCYTFFRPLRRLITLF
jgi:hypothetical protein